MRGVGQPSDQATEVGRERRRPPRASGHVATKALENEASQTQSHARTRRPETILFSRSRTSHPKTHSQTRRGLPDGRRENPDHRKTSTPTPRPTRQTDYTLVCEEPVYPSEEARPVGITQPELIWRAGRLPTLILARIACPETISSAARFRDVERVGRYTTGTHPSRTRSISVNIVLRSNPCADTTFRHDHAVSTVG